MITRRDMIKKSVLGAAGMAALNPLALPALTPRLPATAKSVIQIWMSGGPSHLDTFDPKPEAGSDYCGPLDKPIETNVKGIRISQLLPLLAKQADKYSIIRSMTHEYNSHETASYIVRTGHELGRLAYPCIGAVVSRFRGYDSGYNGVAPPYVVLTEPQGRFSESGFLGHDYKPFVTGGDPKREPFAVEGIIANGITDKRQHQRRELLHALDSLGKAMPENKKFRKLDSLEQEVYDMMFGDARDLFDLKQENQKTRENYGLSTFGQSCLVARRLVESGVPYVTINYEGWDTHKQHFVSMNRNLPEMDKAMAALFQDLSDRGLLDSTIVWWTGEFGRSPKIDWDPPWNGGRDHYSQCFCSVLGGGGFRGGQVVGKSNEKGTEVAERPVFPTDLLRGIYELLGINPDGPLPNERGLEVEVMPKLERSSRLDEIMPARRI
jgi:hypothetical protein